MGQIIKCDICGKIYNESHLATHKRLSHGKRETPPSAQNGTASVEVILSIYKKLPEEWKKEVLTRLTADDQTKP
ncbi:MAG TPA: hypothetical protein VI431_17905 [Candidatus Acidoferrum sp.]